MTSEVKLNYNINDVEALWPRINKPYKYDTMEQRTIPCNPTDDGASYTIQFRMSSAQAKELFKNMAEAYKVKKESGWPAKFDLPFKKEEGGTFTFKAKLKGAYGTDVTRKPSQYDSKGIKLPDDFLLTTGSKVNIAIVFVPYNMREAGVSLRLKAVQVLELKEMKEDSPFGAVEGFEFKEANSPFKEEVLNDPVKEPKKVVKKSTPTPKDVVDDDLSAIVDNWDD
tara:strand:+ start:880 stop:1554 length:675 start_codon:yes stop_codon:yes gene_type:complete